MPFYLIGAIPTGIVVARIHGVDITQHGSGNVGATNIARTLGKKAGLITLLVDCLKGVLAVLLAQIFFGNELLSGIAGMVSVMGHCFSIPGKLRGGKGVATGLGVITALAPMLGLAVLAIFLGVFGAFRIVSLSSIIAALSASALGLIFYPQAQWHHWVAFIGFLIVYKHKENLQRIILGTEPKFSFKSSKS